MSLEVSTTEMLAISAVSWLRIVDITPATEQDIQGVPKKMTPF